MARIRRVLGAIGAITRLVSVVFLLPAFVAVWYDTPDLRIAGALVPRGIFVFTGCAALTFALGTIMRRMAGTDQGKELRERDAYLVVGLGWLWLCVLFMIPFMLEGVLVHPIDAFFEAMSGMTTTGATVIDGDLDDVPKSLMIWRALLQFLGGMGIIVLGVALLSKLTQGGTALLSAESPGPSIQRIAPRISQTARILWTVYGSFAALLFAVLFVVLMRHDLGFKQTLYEALLHTFTTISTGGFGAHTASIAYFDDWLMEFVIIVFMLVSGTNFTLHYALIRGKGRALWRDAEWRFFMGTYVFTTLAVTGLLWRAGQSAGPAMRDAAFTVASLITSTGFSTADFDQWPEAAKGLLLLVMVTGATAGSTGGGLKHVRVLLLFQIVRHQFRRMAHPRAVTPIKFGGRRVPEATLNATVAFFFAFVGIWLVGALALMSFDKAFANPVDAASASISALSNMGPGFGVVGPAENYANIAPHSKLLLAFEEWFGRLEVFAAILVFTPETWKH